MKLISALLFSFFLTACATSPSPHFQQDNETSLADFKTFSIQKIDTEGLTPEAMVRVGKGIKYALEQRGLSYVESDADLLVEYAVGLKLIKEVQMHSIPVGGSVYTDHIVEDNIYATLIIKMSDTAKEKSVWTMTGSRRIENLDKPQSEINTNFVKLLSNFE